jgi:hypothetical protein
LPDFLLRISRIHTTFRTQAVLFVSKGLTFCFWGNTIRFIPGFHREMSETFLENDPEMGDVVHYTARVVFTRRTEFRIRATRSIA